ncbi:MAG: sulfatase [Acidobacteriota bacterium]
MATSGIRISAGLGWLSVAGIVLTLAGCLEPAPFEDPPNILLVVTDDQRWDTLSAMPRMAAALGPRGVRFDNAFVTNPVCCPFRSSLLAGGFYSHETGVLTATPANGAAPRFDDRRTLGTLLQEQGYRTGLIGKYLNRYDLIAPRVPPGWDFFFASQEPHDWYRTPWIRGSSGPRHATVGEAYVSERHITRVERSQALAFLGVDDPRPFFLMVATHAPHRPAIAPQKDRRLYRDFEYRDRAWGEEDLSDKPDYVRRRQGFFEREQTLGGRLVDLPQRQLASLQLVDRLVVGLLGALEAAGESDRTVVIFTSDNGMLWGEHRLYTKAMPYEEAIRVPLLIRAPGSLSRVVESLVAVDLDVAATVLDFAGVRFDGRGHSLRPWLMGDHGVDRSEILLEGFGVDPDVTPAWTAVRTADWKLVEYATGERELYDLRTDPFEENSRHREPAQQAHIADLTSRLEGFRGLAIADSVYLPPAQVGASFEYRFSARGGSGSRHWQRIAGSVPPGLAVAPDGSLAGVPRRAGDFRFTLEVEDASTSPVTGKPQSHRRQFHLSVSP